MSVILKSGASSTTANITTNNALQVFTGDAATPASVGSVRMFSENDAGTITGTAYLQSPEVTDDYQMRVAVDTLLDNETFNYTAQNTGKHTYLNTTMTQTWNTTGLVLNGSSITTTTTGITSGTYAFFPLFGATHTYIEFQASFSSLPVANAIIDFGAFLRGASTPYAPTDGVYFRLTSSGLMGVINYNGTENTTSSFFSSYTLNKKYKFTISATERTTEFWIDDVLYAELDTPVAQGQSCMSASLPVSWRMAHTGAAGSVLQMTITDYYVFVTGQNIAKSFASIGNCALGSYQGLSGGTMGSLASYANSTNPTSAAGSNAAANVTGLGGQGAINAAATAATDFIMTSYQNPAGTVSVQGKRLVINGVKISCANLGAAVATTATTIALSLAFGHTAVSLATTEAATTKAPRRIPLGMMYWNVAAPIGATPQNGDVYMKFDNPIYVNPSEFIATTLKFITGTATASQSIWYHVTFDYGWE